MNSSFFLHLSLILSLTSVSNSLSFPYDHVLVCGSGSQPLLTAKLAHFAGVNKIDCLISSVNEQESYECMFGEDYSPTKDSSGYLTNIPKVSAPNFGADSCKGNLRLLLADKDDISPVLSAVDAVIFCSDALGPPVPPEVASGLLESASNLKAVSVLSRTMNEEGYGFFATAARAAANKEIWDNNKKDRQRLVEFEDTLKEGVKEVREKGEKAKGNMTTPH
jgi:hypothetical protein